MAGFASYLQQQQTAPASPQMGPQTPGQMTFMLAMAAMRHRLAMQGQPAPAPAPQAPADPEYDLGYRIGLQLAKGRP